jgi:ADP-ribosylglycohydrolase
MAYEDAMYDILGYGGDTDTNACIIGGLLGAAQGLESLKDEWIEKVLNYDSTAHISKGMRRPAFL